MTTASLFFRRKGADLRALTVVLRGNLVLVVVLVLESKAFYYLSNILYLSIRFLLTEGKDNNCALH